MKTATLLYPTDPLENLIKLFFPSSLGLLFHQLLVDSSELTLVLASSRSEACCPLCWQPTARIHSRYTRALQDLPWSTFRVRLCVQVRRFFCVNTSCVRRIFTEQLPELAERYARRTNRLRDALLALGWALGGEAAARQCTSHAMPICGATILALLRKSGAEVLPTPRVLGVDDWSFRSRTAGTLLVDLEQHRPVEVLLGSDEQVLSDWLLAHPGVEVISRDRGASYLSGATKGAPEAQQVLDRWHLLKNLGEVLQKILSHHVDVLEQAAHEALPVETDRQPSGGECSTSPVADKVTQEGVQEKESLCEPAAPISEVRQKQARQRKPAVPTQQRSWQLHTYEQVHRLAAEGWSQPAIRKHLHISPTTLRKYLGMEQFVDLRHCPHPSPVEPYRAYVEERWSQGCTMVKALWEELKGLGFTGSYHAVWSFTRHFPLPEVHHSVSSPPKRIAQQPRTPWQARWLLLTSPEKLSARDASYCQAVYHLSPALAEAASLARKLVSMIRERKPDQFETWLDQACASPLQELHRFALGLQAEYGAARAALSEPWSTGQVEGQITRLKYLKRQMYGRANIDLLRLRVLHAA